MGLACRRVALRLHLLTVAGSCLLEEKPGDRSELHTVGR